MTPGMMPCPNFFAKSLFSNRFLALAFYFLRNSQEHKQNKYPKVPLLNPQVWSSTCKLTFIPLSANVRYIRHDTVITSSCNSGHSENHEKIWHFRLTVWNFLQNGLQAFDLPS